MLATAAALTAFTLVAHTDRGDYWSLDGKNKPDVVCIERTLSKFEREMGSHVPRIAYYRVNTPAQVARFAVDYAQGVYNTPRGIERYLYTDEQHPVQPRITATGNCSVHEIAHAATFALGDPGLFWDEGLATTLSGTPYFNGGHQKYLARRNKLTLAQAKDGFRGDIPNADMRLRWYEFAAAFVQHIGQRYGVQKRNAFFARTPDGNAAPSAFLEIYGMTEEQAWNEWLYGSAAAPQ